MAATSPRRFSASFAPASGQPRGQLEEEIDELFGDLPQPLVHNGLAKLLEDRCEFEVQSGLPPEQVRDAVFLAAAKKRQEVWRKSPGVFARRDRAAQSPLEMNTDAAQIGGEPVRRPEKSSNASRLPRHHGRTASGTLQRRPGPGDPAALDRRRHHHQAAKRRRTIGNSFARSSSIASSAMSSYSPHPSGGEGWG